MALLYYALRVRRGCGQLVLWCYLTIADFHSSPGCCVSSIEASVEKVAMVVGLVPLLFASGAGASSRFGLGIVIVVGMIVGTLFTLFVLPSVYTVISKRRPQYLQERACSRAV